MNDRQQAFVTYYVGVSQFNAADAAKRAGYAAAGVEGHRLKNDPEVRAAIDAFLAAETLSAKEVLARLTDHARGTLKHFIQTPKRVVSSPEFDNDGEEAPSELMTIPYGTPRINLASAEANEHFHLLKKLKIKERQGGKDEEAWTETEYEFEIHDPQAALVHLGRHYRLFTDGHMLTGADGGAIQHDIRNLDGLTPEQLVRLHQETLGDSE